MYPSTSESQLFLNASLLPYLASSGTSSGSSVESLIWTGYPSGIENAFNPDLSDLELLAALLDDDTSALSQALVSTPTVNSEKIVWGSQFTGMVIDWQPQGRFESLDSLQSAIESGAENGMFDTIRLIENGRDLLVIEFTDSALRFSTGALNFQFDGNWQRGFQDLLELASVLSEITPASVGSAQFSVLDEFAFYGFSLSEGNREWLQFRLGADELSVSVAGASVSVKGALPFESLGSLLDFAGYLDGLGAEVISYDQLQGYYVERVEIHNDVGTFLIGLYPGSDPFSKDSIDKLVIRGDSASDYVDLSAIDLSADFDVINADLQSGDDYLYASDGYTVGADLGAGVDTVVFLERFDQYDLQFTDVGVWVNATGSFETDYLVNAEWFEFQDVRLSFAELSDASLVRPPSLSYSVVGDHARFVGDRDEVRLTPSSDGIVIEEMSGGTTILTDVYRFEFDDGAVAFDMDGNAGKVAKILGATFGSESLGNELYVGIGLAYLDMGTSYEELCELALRVQGVTSHIQVVEHLYLNLVGVLPSSENASSFVSWLDSGIFTVGELAAFAADLSLNEENIGLSGLRTSGLDYQPFDIFV